MSENTDMAELRPGAGESRTSRALCSCHFSEPEAWATANSLGINGVYEAMRRELDPLPHLRIGRKRLIDDTLAVAWYRRNYGVNTEGDAA